MPLAQTDARQRSSLPDGSTEQSLAFGKSSGDQDGQRPVKGSTLHPAEVQQEDIDNPAVRAAAASAETFGRQEDSSRQGAAASPILASVQARDQERDNVSPGQAATRISPAAASLSGPSDGPNEHRHMSLEMQPGGSTLPNIMKAQSQSGAPGPDSSSQPVQQQQSVSAAIAESQSSRESGQPGTASLPDSDTQPVAAQEGTGHLLEPTLVGLADSGEHACTHICIWQLCSRKTCSCHISQSCHDICIDMRSIALFGWSMRVHI